MSLALLCSGAALGSERSSENLDRTLRTTLRNAEFTGRVESTLESRLGRMIDSRLVDLGRLLFFDTLTGLHDDNTCAGCHAPATGFGDTQSIAIGIQSNLAVGPAEQGRASSGERRRW